VSKPVNKAVLGGFVVAAIALFVAAVLVFGSGKFFKTTVLRVMYFDGSVKGLNVGAPVLFRGVKIGSVKEINLHWDLTKNAIDIPVVAEIEPGAFNVVGGTLGTRDPAQGNRELIEQGLRAQLETQSFVTGQLLIILDFHPGTPVTLHKDAPYLEIPTIPTTLQQIAKTIEELPLKEIVSKLSSALDSIDKLASSPELKESVVNLNLLLQDARKLVQDVDTQVNPIGSEVQGAVKDARKLVRNADRQISSLGSSARETLGETKKLVQHVDGRIDPLYENIQDLIHQIKGAIKQAETVLKELEGGLRGDSNLMIRLTEALAELEKAARAVRFLADDLERKPEALLRGKGTPGGK